MKVCELLKYYTHFSSQDFMYQVEEKAAKFGWATHLILYNIYFGVSICYVKLVSD